MEYDEVSASQKRIEVRTQIEKALEQANINNPDEMVAVVMKAFVNVSAPSREHELLGLMTVTEGGVNGGTTAKPGNIVLNWRKLVRAIATGTLTVVGAATAPWTLVIGALVTWDSLWSSIRIDITEVQACVIWSLWKNADSDATVQKSTVVGMVNHERQDFGKQTLSDQEINRALKELESMKCLRTSQKTPDRWWLCEYVNIRYT